MSNFVFKKKGTLMRIQVILSICFYVEVCTLQIKLQFIKLDHWEHTAQLQADSHREFRMTELMVENSESI